MHRKTKALISLSSLSQGQTILVKYPLHHVTYAPAMIGGENSMVQKEMLCDKKIHYFTLVNVYVDLLVHFVFTRIAGIS